MTDAYRSLRGDGATVELRRDVVRVVGPDATTFLQGQCSQDVAAVAVGTSSWSWVLQPTGKVDALVRLSRLGPDDWVLDTDAGWGEAVLARLGRFRLRTKVDLEPLDWRVVAVRGGAAEAVTPGTEGTSVVAAADWPGLGGVDLVGASPVPPPGLPVATAGEWEAARIEAGIPVMGAELTERTIPGETGLVERTVSFTKGCYTGQELVARIDSRGGNVPRHLVGFRLSAAVAAGTAVVSADADAGTLTSVGVSPGLGYVALGYVKRAVPDGAILHADGVEATVTPLPMVGAA